MERLERLLHLFMQIIRYNMSHLWIFTNILQTLIYSKHILCLNRCMFRERNNTLPSFLDEIQRKIRTPSARNRQCGQLFLVLGGTLTLTACKF